MSFTRFKSRILSACLPYKFRFDAIFYVALRLMIAFFFAVAFTYFTVWVLLALIAILLDYFAPK
jgi:hypothetical protein